MKERKTDYKKASCYNTQCDSFDDELMEMKQFDKELYLFMRGGFAAK
jgi:hypothetical protein